MSDDFKKSEDDTSRGGANSGGTQKRSERESRSQRASAEEGFRAAFEEINELFRKKPKPNKERHSRTLGDVNISMQYF